MREPSIPTLPDPPESIKEITEKIRKAIALNPKVELKIPAHLVNRVNAELKRQRAGLALKLNRPAVVAQRPVDETKKARNARRNARKKDAARLDAANRAAARPPVVRPSAPRPAPVMMDERADAVDQGDIDRYWAAKGGVRDDGPVAAEAVGGQRPDALERLTGSTGPR